jgi:hypothetical protein
MKRAFLSIAMLLLLLASPAFGRVPELNVKAVCDAEAADAKTLRSTPEQSVADCVRDEEAQKQRLSALWTSTSGPIRNRCEGDARALGTTSYLDLLTCIQMVEDLKSNPKTETGK